MARVSPTPHLPRPFVTVAQRLFGVRLQVLGADEVDAARALLWQIYCREQGWAPAPGNPSEQHIDGDRLVDAYDATAVWVGAWADDTLVGCLRVLAPERVGTLELARYITLPADLPPRTGEANRVAIAPSHRRGPTIGLLTVSGALIARRLGLSLVLGTTTDRIYRRAAHPGGWRDLGLRFRYHPDDPAPVLLVGFDLRATRWTARVALGVARRALPRRWPLPVPTRP